MHRYATLLYRPLCWLLAAGCMVASLDYARSIPPPPSTTPAGGTVVHAGIPFEVQDYGVTTVCVSSSSGQALTPFVLASK